MNNTEGASGTVDELESLRNEVKLLRDEISLLQRDRFPSQHSAQAETKLFAVLPHNRQRTEEDLEYARRFVETIGPFVGDE
jgi:hypothetical protein